MKIPSFLKKGVVICEAKLSVLHEAKLRLFYEAKVRLSNGAKMRLFSEAKERLGQIPIRDPDLGFLCQFLYSSI